VTIGRHHHVRKPLNVGLRVDTALASTMGEVKDAAKPAPSEP
jgi:hypothetical protein